MVDIQTVSIAVASASVVAGVIYYAIQIRHQTRMRETDFIVRLYSTYGSKEFHEMVMKLQSLQFNDYEDFVNKYGPWLSEGPAETAVFVVASFLSEVGVLLHRKIIGIDFLYDIFGSAPIKMNWEKVKPVVLGIREQFPQAFVWFEYLYNEMKKREQKPQQSKV